MGAKYDSSINIVGSIPDYAVMTDYILASECQDAEDDKFSFRTAKATTRFKKAVDVGFLSFHNEQHRDLFLSALRSNEFSAEEKLVVLFWQFVCCNQLFREVNDQVFLKALYSGRTCIDKSDVSAFLKHLKRENPEDMPFSDSTIETIASKYLTILKKFGFAEGKLHKEIHAPHISSTLFIYLVKFAMAVFPEDNTLSNPIFQFSFLDKQSIINRLKTIEYIPLWDITQIGNDITISLKRHDKV